MKTLLRLIIAIIVYVPYIFIMALAISLFGIITMIAFVKILIYPIQILSNNGPDDTIKELILMFSMPIWMPSWCLYKWVVTGEFEYLEMEKI